MASDRQKVWLVLGAALLLAAAGAALALALDAPEPQPTPEPQPDHAMAPEDACAHMPEHCGGDGDG